MTTVTATFEGATAAQVKVTGNSDRDREQAQGVSRDGNAGVAGKVGKGEWE